MKHRHRLLAALAGGVLCGAAAAYGAPITGEVSINGSDSFTLSPPSITFSGAGNVGGTTGSFTVLANCSGCVTMLAGTFTATSSGTLFNIVDAGHTSMLDIVPPSTFIATPNPNPSLDALEATGSGTLTLDGMSVAGSYVLTTQGPTSASVTFSATAVPSGVSEPSTLFLLGSGLIGWFVGFRYWRGRRDAAAFAKPRFAVAA